MLPPNVTIMPLPIGLCHLPISLCVVAKLLPKVVAAYDHVELFLGRVVRVGVFWRDADGKNLDLGRFRWLTAAVVRRADTVVAWMVGVRYDQRDIVLAVEAVVQDRCVSAHVASPILTGMALPSAAVATTSMYDPSSRTSLIFVMVYGVSTDVVPLDDGVDVQ